MDLTHKNAGKKLANLQVVCFHEEEWAPLSLSRKKCQKHPYVFSIFLGKAPHFVTEYFFASRKGECVWDA